MMNQGPVAEQSELILPKTPAGRQLAAFLPIFNAGDPSDTAAFIGAHFDPAALERRPAQQQAAFFAMVHDDSRGLDPSFMEHSSDHTITVLARSRLAGEWLRLHLEVSPTPPHPIVTCAVHFALQPEDLPIHASADESDVAAMIAPFLETLVDADLFSGAVLVARHGTPLMARAYGVANRSFGVPNGLDTRFNLGSMNKMFTAVAVAQLVERGDIAFGDLIGRYLPNYPAAVGSRVAIHHLLTHTSGLGSYWNDRFEATKTRRRTVEDFIPLFEDEPLLFEPGTRWLYSNAGYILLGAIIERVSGQTYFDYVREAIYTPAEMPNTDAYDLDLPVPRLAVGYTHTGPDGHYERGVWRSNLFMHVIKGGPAGGGYSTIGDLLNFSQALLGHRLLGPAMTELVLAGKVETDGPGAHYAYGFLDEQVRGARIVGHSGGFPGINGILDMYLDRGYTVAVLANQDPPAAQRVAHRLRELLAGS